MIQKELIWGNHCLDDEFVEENANKYGIVYFSRLHSESWNKPLVDRCRLNKQHNQTQEVQIQFTAFLLCDANKRF